VSPEGDSLREVIAEFLLDGLAAVGYDALGLGELELELGAGYLARAADSLPLVCANLEPHPALGAKIPRFRRIDAGGRWIAVTAYVDPLLYYEWPHAFEDGSLGLTDPGTALEAVLLEVAGADLVVVLAHAPREAIEELIPRLKGIDVVVQGHEPEGPRESSIGKAYFLIPGPRSRDVSLVSLVHDASGEVTRIEPRWWRLSSMDTGDPKLDAMLRAFMNSHGLKREPGPQRAPGRR
jgi:2',3'-cyclic-nucleotide 2'-phosphodiesterase (5'-nucleotidase family)